MKKILFTFALTALVMTAGAQVKELEPNNISEWIDPATIVQEECDDCPEDGEGDTEQDCFPVTNIKATSRLASQGKNNYDEKNLYDYNNYTPWVEGVKGYGIGEKITFTLKDATAAFTGISIVNGYSKSKTAWKNNSRVKKLKLTYNGTPMYVLNLKDQMGGQYFDFGMALNADMDNLDGDFTVTLEILDVYKGDKWDDTAISEVTFGGCY
jgi:hypothetical protein